MKPSRLFGTPAAAAALLLFCTRGDIAGQSSTAARPNASDREYRLESSMLGYRGVGGEIDGIRNPTLWALTGETVRITIVNGELMVHDIALEKHDVKSTEILDKGATTNITFKADASDTYFCSMPGPPRGRHGRPPRGFRHAAVRSDGVPAGSERPARSTSTSSRARSRTGPRPATPSTLVKGDGLPEAAPTGAARRAASPAPSGSAAA